jgi:hypothetical protein
MPFHSFDTTHLQLAAQVYIQRKLRMAHPVGILTFNGQWLPDELEKQACCDEVKPSNNLNRLEIHCRTIKHVAYLHTVPEDELRLMINIIERNGNTEDNETKLNHKILKRIYKLLTCILYLQQKYLFRQTPADKASMNLL